MEDKKHSFMDQLNLFFIGTVIGVIVGACFGINAVKGSNNRAEKKVKAYEEYHKCTETLLDSLDGTHNLDLMDTKKYVCTNECLCCFDGNYEKFDFCMELPIGLSIKPIKKHKG